MPKSGPAESTHWGHGWNGQTWLRVGGNFYKYGRKCYSIIQSEYYHSWMIHQQNVQLFGSHNSTTQLFWTATPILPGASRSCWTGWMQNDVLFRCPETYFQVFLNPPEVAEQNTRLFHRVWSNLQNAIKSSIQVRKISELLGLRHSLPRAFRCTWS